MVTSVGAPPGVNVLRSLSQTKKYSLVAADADKYAPGLYQYTNDRVILPFAKDASDYINAICNYCTENKVKVIIPCLEDEVILFSKSLALFAEKKISVLVPDYQSVRKAINKSDATILAKQLGISVPKSILIPKLLDVEAAKKLILEFIKNCNLPWILKPNYGWGSRGLHTIYSIEDAVSKVISSPYKQLLQEFIPGPTGSMHCVGLLYSSSGDIVRRFSSRSIKTLHEFGGPATAGVSIRKDLIINQTESLISSIGVWSGPLMAEWLHDPRDGSFKFIEINPRMWGYGYLATASGINFPDAIVELALGNTLSPDQGFKEGITLIRGSEDLIFTINPIK